MSLRILLVDDSLTFVGAVRQFLALLPGASVVGEAHDGKDAIEKVRTLSPDLVLLDVSMPGVGGVEVARTLRLWPQPPSVVFLSMHDASAYQTMADELGALAYINKSDFVLRLLPIIERMVAVSAAQSHEN
ncbi:response regulator [Rhodoferax mekongensis]|uniref:response regulator n=1 Tax=Rhodoferax mekongensis TaxID=3068341 RepID=UPI0028BF01C6|nr:response regulator transcription factor [Rhodoferax sp. TBRC 17199]MDT7514481.1 response regulator transcription factor [Rhodoferax sp. TBRC 17199]